MTIQLMVALISLTVVLLLSAGVIEDRNSEA